jgi:hypothetical protein
MHTPVISDKQLARHAFYCAKPRSDQNIAELQENKGDGPLRDPLQEAAVRKYVGLEEFIDLRATWLPGTQGRRLGLGGHQEPSGPRPKRPGTELMDL